jgi:hypothetical protein
MEWQAWKKALELYVKTPELTYASIFVCIAIFGIAWWLRSRISKEQIAALKEQLSFAKNKQENFAADLETVKRQVSQQGTIINDLRSRGGVPRGQLELLSSANTTVASSIDNLTQANHDLGITLIITTGDHHAHN